MQRLWFQYNLTDISLTVNCSPSYNCIRITANSNPAFPLLRLHIKSFQLAQKRGGFYWEAANSIRADSGHHI